MTADETSAVRGPKPRPGSSSTTRRVGYAIAVVIDATLLVLVHVWPGWRTITVLTPDAALVVPWIDAALIAGILVNLVDLVFDQRWLKAIGDLITTVIGLIAAIVLWNVFPFDFRSVGGVWETVVRILVFGGIVGSAIGIIVAVVGIVRLMITGSRR